MKTQTVYDEILKQDVPSVVFIRNQQVLDEILKTQIEDDEKKRKLALMQSQINLYMHSFTSEQLGVDLDSSIYTGFI